MTTNTQKPAAGLAAEIRLYDVRTHEAGATERILTNPDGTRGFRTLSGEHQIHFSQDGHVESVGVRVTLNGKISLGNEPPPPLSSVATEEFWKLAFLLEAAPRLLAAVKALLASKTDMDDTLRLELEVAVAEAESGRQPLTAA